MKELEKLKFDKIAPAKLKKKKSSIPSAADDDDEDSDDNEENYDYLFSMKLWSLTMEKVASLKRQRDEKEAELNEMRAKEPEELWEADLDDLENVIKELAEAEDEEAAAAKLQRDKLKSKRKAKRKKTTKKKKTSKKKISSTVDLTDGASLPASPARSEMTDVISVLSPESDVEIMSLADRLKARMLSSQESDPSALAAIARGDAIEEEKNAFSGHKEEEAPRNG